MDTSSATAQDHLRKAIDGEIKVSEQVTRELKYRRNALAPISRLPPETLAEIFSLLPFSAKFYEDVPYLEWIRVTHVCHRWREIALTFPYLWNHIHFTKLTLAGTTELLARAKMSPLHCEADFFRWNEARFKAFGRQLEAHISHTRHLTISGDFPTELEPLVSPAPALVSLSMANSSFPSTLSHCTIPDSLFNGTAPKLTRVELRDCGITWTSPLLKGLQILKIWAPSEQARPTLGDWLAALNQMSHLKTLHLSNATPAVSIDNPLMSEPQRTVTLPSLTHFDITASAKGCALALAHLVLPALISLHVTSVSQRDDVRLLIPYVAQNAHGPQDTAPLQTIMFSGEATYAEIAAWTVPYPHVEDCNLGTMIRDSASARLVLTVRPDTDSEWRNGTDTVIFDAMLSHLPLNAISTLSALNNSRLSEEVWLSHAPRLTMLKRAFLVPTAVRAFREMLEEDVPPNGLPRVPQLTKLVLSQVVLTALRTYHLRDMLVKRREHGTPLEVLDLRTCIGTDRAIQLLSGVVGNVQWPAATLKVGLPAFFNWERRVGPFDEEERTDDDEYDDGAGPLYAGMDDDDEDDDDFDLDNFVDH